MGRTATSRKPTGKVKVAARPPPPPRRTPTPAAAPASSSSTALVILDPLVSAEQSAQAKAADIKRRRLCRRDSDVKVERLIQSRLSEIPSQVLEAVRDSEGRSVREYLKDRSVPNPWNSAKVRISQIMFRIDQDGCRFLMGQHQRLHSSA